MELRVQPLLLLLYDNALILIWSWNTIFSRVHFRLCGPLLLRSFRRNWIQIITHVKTGERLLIKRLSLLTAWCLPFNKLFLRDVNLPVNKDKRRFGCDAIYNDFSTNVVQCLHTYIMRCHLRLSFFNASGVPLVSFFDHPSSDDSFWI